MFSTLSPAILKVLTLQELQEVRTNYERKFAVADRHWVALRLAAMNQKKLRDALWEQIRIIRAEYQRRGL